MKSLKNYLILLLVAAVTVSSCRKKSNDDDDDIQLPPETISGNITANKTLTNDRVWFLDGYVYVTSGVTLTIEPGTVIKGTVGAKSTLIVERGAKLMAQGEPTRPIVFTSGKAAGDRNPGDWGGIMLLGKAPTNRTTEPIAEGGVNRGYGGTDANDNSGILKYVRIEFAGVTTDVNSEVNGLTLCGVGAGTVIENVQVSYGKDDAFEFFGGTVNCKNLIAYITHDDDFDFDFGYSGSIQFAVALRDPLLVDAGDAGNGIECDNDGTGTAATPLTNPKLSNFTIVGPNNAAGTAANHNWGNRWRRNSTFTFNNSIILGTQKGGLSVESAGTATALKTGVAEYKNNITAAFTNNFLSSDAAAQAVITPTEMETIAKATGVVFTDGNTSVKLNSPFNLAAPNFLPATGSPALSGTFAAVTGAQSVSYRGAFGTTDWTTGWASWTPKTNTY